MASEHDINRYLDLTRAAMLLADMDREATALRAMLHAVPFDDGGGNLEACLHEALDHHWTAAGRVAVGAAEPTDPTALDRDFSDALADAVDRVRSAAERIAQDARTVARSLDAGLITNARRWSAQEVTAGRMKAALAAYRDDPAGDFVVLCDYVEALRSLHRARAITDAVYDESMAVLDEAGFYVTAEPDYAVKTYADLMEPWRTARAKALCLFDDVVPTIRARQAINVADLATLTSYTKGLLFSDAWADDVRTAMRHLVAVMRRAYTLAAAAAAGTPDPQAEPLIAELERWRATAFAARISHAMAALEANAQAPSDDRDQSAYEALYDANELAVNTAQLLEVWNLAAGLAEGHRDNIRTGIIIRFEESKTGTGAALDDGEASESDAMFHATGELRAAVDAYPLSEHSNILHAVRYRTHLAALRAIDADAPDAGRALTAAWRDAIADIDSGEVTERQAKALRTLWSIRSNDIKS